MLILIILISRRKNYFFICDLTPVKYFSDDNIPPKIDDFSLDFDYWRRYCFL